jgi:enolase
MPKIAKIKCHKVVNSRGDWTIDTQLALDNGIIVSQTVPEGASKGENEAVSIPPEQAVEIVSTAINDALEGMDVFDQKKIDTTMLEMDGTPNKKHLGGNSILSVSLAVADAAAKSQDVELYEYLAELYSGKKITANEKLKFPTPLFNVLNGGKHARNGLSFQEFMVIPSPDKPFDKAMELGVLVYHALKEILISGDMETAVGDEGGFAPENLTLHKALDYIRRAVFSSYKPGQDAFFGIDAASESFYKEGKYVIPEENLTLSPEELGDYYASVLKQYEIIYLEDPFYEKDYSGWKNFYKNQNEGLMVVGDDLVVTNPKYLKKAIEDQLANAVIVKPNQVGTLTETLQFIKDAKKAGMSVIVSHRSGDTAEDTFIADLALGVGADFLKSGSPVRGERVVKYNRLLDIFDSRKRN